MTKMILRFKSTCLDLGSFGEKYVAQLLGGKEVGHHRDPFLCDVVWGDIHIEVKSTRFMSSKTSCMFTRFNKVSRPCVLVCVAFLSPNKLPLLWVHDGERGNYFNSRLSDSIKASKLKSAVLVVHKQQLKRHGRHKPHERCGLK